MYLLYFSEFKICLSYHRVDFKSLFKEQAKNREIKADLSISSFSVPKKVKATITYPNV